MEVKKIITKRICDLQKGEKFMYMGIQCLLKSKTDRIHYVHRTPSGMNHKYSFGLNNQAKVEIIPLAEKPDSNPS